MTVHRSMPLVIETEHGQPKLPGYTMPTWCELFAPPTVKYSNGTVLLAICRAGPGKLDGLVPAPLRPVDDRMYLWLNDFQTDKIGDYREFIVSAKAQFSYGGADYLGLYKLYLVLDVDCPIAAGRDIWGFPKKGGAFGWQGPADPQIGDNVTRSVRRHDVDLCQISARLDGPGDPADVADLLLPYLNLKVVPSARPPIVGNEGQRTYRFDVCRLTGTTLRGVDVTQLIACEGSAELWDSEDGQDPLASELGPLSVEKVFYVGTGFHLTFGADVFDYHRQEFAPPSEWQGLWLPDDEVPWRTW